MIPEIDIEELVNDRNAFNAFVYTPLGEAIIELEQRRRSDVKDNMINVPDIFNNEPKVLIFRQVITPNYEIRRFISIADAIGINPIFMDHYKDIFVAKNGWKYSLGKMFFHKGRDKNGKSLEESLKIINFDGAEGKLLHDLKTLWGQPLIHFHKELFLEYFPYFEENIFSASDWLHTFGKTASEYYEPFLRLFIKRGILFENFLVDKEELYFSKEIFLPAFIKVYKDTGYKPLIVALEPTDIEGERFWMNHPYDAKKIIQQKIMNCPIIID